MAPLDDLRPKLRGALLMPSDPGYDDHRSIWNAMIDRRPAAIARCLGVADVVTCVNTAREQGLPLCIKGGGHNIAGLAVADGALVLDMSLMRGVWVDPARKIARAQCGCLLGDVDRETQLHGLAATLGFVSMTGIAGLTLGGGFGYLTRRFGWTSDGVLSMDVVTAEGKLVRASEQENADLFWGLRGGGGNFGVVTSVEYQLNPIGPEIVGGAVAWPAEEAPKVLELYRTMTAELPPEATLVTVMRKAPPAPWIAKEMHGKPIIIVLLCHTGAIADGEKTAARLKGFGKPVGDVMQRRSYVSLQSLLDGTQPKGRRYYWKSEYLAGPTAEMMPVIMKHAATITSPNTGIALFQLDGALNTLPEAHSAVGNRNAGMVVNVIASWEKAADDSTEVEWARAAWRDLRRFSTGGVYVNFLTEEEIGDRIKSAYGANYARLAEVKAAWDPQNLFRANKNIPPQR